MTNALLLGSCLTLSACTGIVGSMPSDDAGLQTLDSGGGAGGGGGAAGGFGGAGGAGGAGGGGGGGGCGGAAGIDAGTDAGSTVDAGIPRTIFVIGGQDMRRIVSFDGRTWEHDVYVAPNGEDNAFSAIAVGNRTIIASGDPGIYRSTDGITWSLAMARPSRFAFHASVAIYAAGVFVVVGQDAAYRSPDGVTWTTATGTGNSGHWQSIAYGNGHWVALGDGHHKVSEDGLAWHDYNATADVNAFGSIAFGNGVFVEVGKLNNMARVATSPDGLVWTERAPVATLYNTGFMGIAFGNGKFLTNDCCNAFESTDAVTWNKRGGAYGAGIVFAGGTFVGSGWRTSAYLYNEDAGTFGATFSGDMPNQFPDAGIWPWFTGLGAGEIYAP